MKCSQNTIRETQGRGRERANKIFEFIKKIIFQFHEQMWKHFKLKQANIRHDSPLEVPWELLRRLLLMWLCGRLRLFPFICGRNWPPLCACCAAAAATAAKFRLPKLPNAFKLVSPANALPVWREDNGELPSCWKASGPRGLWRAIAAAAAAVAAWLVGTPGIDWSEPKCPTELDEPMLAWEAEGGGGEQSPASTSPYCPYDDRRPSRRLPSMANCNSSGELRCSRSHSYGYKYFMYLRMERRSN